MIKMVVFDMAGTTINEDNVVYKTIHNTLSQNGYNFTLEEVLSVAAGKEKLQAIRSVLALRNIKDETLSQEMFAQFSTALDQVYATLPVTEQPHATQLFQALRQRGIYAVLNTGYSRPIAVGLLSKIGWQPGQDIDALVTASDVPQNRPFPDMIHYAMEQMNITDAKAVAKVGDSAIDIEEGRNAGCQVNIGITTGAQTRAQLLSAAPTAIIDDLLEVLNYLS